MLESGFSFRGKSPIPYLLLFECKYWTFIQPFYLCVIQLYNITNYSNVTGAYFSKNLQTLPVQLYIRFFPYLTIYFWSVYIITIYVASIICCSPMQAAYFVISWLYIVSHSFSNKKVSTRQFPKFWLSFDCLSVILLRLQCFCCVIVIMELHLIFPERLATFVGVTVSHRIID